MTNRLAPIIEQKHREVAVLQSFIAAHPQHRIAQILQGNGMDLKTKSFKKALRGNALAVIAEIKRKSPSKGTLATIQDPVSLAASYVAGGANAISVLTDALFFAGHLDDLSAVATALKALAPPVLRKDFIVDAIQIAEAIDAGADAILCIVAVLGARTKDMIDAAKTMGIDVLVEVHDAHELEIAMASGAEIIGVNNRCLTTLTIDTDQAFRLIESIPKDIVRVAESGIFLPQLANDYYQSGFDAVLIGEALVTSDDPGRFIRACQHG